MDYLSVVFDTIKLHHIFETNNLQNRFCK